MSTLTEVLKPFFAERVWRVRHITGSIFHIEAGRVVEADGLTGNTYQKGSLCIVVYLCAWQLSREGQPVCDSSLLAPDVSWPPTCLEGETLIGVEELDPGQEVRLEFTSGYALTLSADSYYDVDDDMFWVCGGSEEVVASYSPSRGLYREA